MEKAYAELVELERQRGLVESIFNLLEWDETTYMPKGGTAVRGDQKAYLVGEMHRRLVHPRVGELLSRVEGSRFTEDRDSATAVNIRNIRREYDRARLLPESLMSEIARLSSTANEAWVEARKTSNFEIFRPFLDQMLELRRQEAKAVSQGEGEPYDALLGYYEPGMSTADVTVVLSELKPRIMKLLDRVAGSTKRPRREILSRRCPVGEQARFNENVMKALGFNPDWGRLDLTTHPYCRPVSPTDVRLATRYYENDVCSGLFSTIHETGHGLYEQGLSHEEWRLPMGKFASFGIHESQSRLWENLVARSPSFWEFFYASLQKSFPGAFGDVSIEDFVFALNAVEKSFIRVESDEVTYNLHIILRFEMELALLRGDLTAADVPAAWNEKFRAIFGMSPPDDSQGCLQDIHWGVGLVGYFPTYTLGNLYAAQFVETAREELGDLDAEYRRGNFTPLLHWLSRHIFLHGQRYTSPELCKKVTGKALSSDPLIRHLTAKVDRFY